jgi:hypothetical protein
MIQTSLISKERAAFHSLLLAGPLTSDSKGILSIADKGSAISRLISTELAKKMGSPRISKKGGGQTAGAAFENIVARFLRATFLSLKDLRPGSWEVLDTSTGGKVQIANFTQYEHLLRLKEKADLDPDLRAILGGDYLIAPDVVIVRSSEPDKVINKSARVVDMNTARLTPLRTTNSKVVGARFLHASVSCKWTLRSDRAQNARSEALNLLRNRKGHAPHVVAITAEPMPSRIASLALGTNDLDCVYHIALPELINVVKQSVNDERSGQLEMLEMLVSGKRLRDISDLPLDLAV